MIKAGVFPLKLAIFMNSPQCIKSIIKGGVDINKVDENGNTPLAVAQIRNKIEIIKILIRVGAKE